MSTENSIAAKFGISYPGFNLDVDLSLPGEGVTVLFGASGCGKTTCLRAIAGLEKPDKGFLSVNGSEWHNSESGRFVPTHQRKIGYVFQESSLFPHLSVKQNLEFGLKRRLSAKTAVQMEQADSRDIYSLLGIESLLERSVNGLSGGERQRIAIARALLTSPELLLMDEPLSALDNGRKKEVLPYLEKLHQGLSIPIIYVTHSVDELTRLSDHLVLFERGRVLDSGPATSVMSDLRHRHLFGENPGSVMDTRISEHSPWHLTRLDGGEGVSLWVPMLEGETGKEYRCRIHASDVSVCVCRPDDSSVQNRIAATIESIGSATQCGEVLLNLRLANDALLTSLITEQSLYRLKLSPGQKVWALIKSVAIC